MKGGKQLQREGIHVKSEGLQGKYWRLLETNDRICKWWKEYFELISDDGI